METKTDLQRAYELGQAVQEADSRRLYDPRYDSSLMHYTIERITLLCESLHDESLKSMGERLRSNLSGARLWYRYKMGEEKRGMDVIDAEMRNLEKQIERIEKLWK